MTEFLHPIMQRIQAQRAKLTPKGRTLCDRIITSPRRVVFMTIRELAEHCAVSEATIVRFVSRLGFKGYSDFQQTLRDVVDAEMTLLERLDLTNLTAPDGKLFGRLIFEEMDNLKLLHESLDLAAAERVVDLLWVKSPVCVIGSRLSYTFAYYLGWSLSKIRSEVRIFKGSDNMTLDWLTIAPGQSLVVVLATSRYPNDLIKTAKAVRRLGHTLVAITDSASCPIIQFADESLVAPSRHIPFIGSPSAISCLINFLTHQLAIRHGDDLKKHQTRLERCYLENDLLFT